MPSGQVGYPNVISGNAQSGVLIFGTAGEGGGDTGAGQPDRHRRRRQHGGRATAATGSSSTAPPTTSVNGNTISGNAQAGVSIFSPATSAPADDNTLSGNLIGGLGRARQSVRRRGHLQRRVQHDRRARLLEHDLRQRRQRHPARQHLRPVARRQYDRGECHRHRSRPHRTSVGTQQNGVLVEAGTGNQIGVAMGSAIPSTNVPTSPSNVISGNQAAGVQFAGTASNNFVQGNYIGVNGSGVYPGSSASTGEWPRGRVRQQPGDEPQRRDHRRHGDRRRQYHRGQLERIRRRHPRTGGGLDPGRQLRPGQPDRHRPQRESGRE